MSSIPYKQLGIDKQGTAFTSNASPVATAQQRFLSENGTASSVVTLTDNTTVVEVGAGSVPIYIRWVPRTDTQASVVAVAGATANFDDYVPANTTRVFPVPQEIQGTSSIVGANVAAGLYKRVAWVTPAAGSIIGIEF